MKNFVAIDFETANQHRSSVCSVGLVVVRNAVVTDRYYSLILPRPNFFIKYTTAVHGLSETDVVGARPFPQVWAEVEPLLQALPLVAHNSAFDEGCLRAAFERYQLPYPNYRFCCTLLAAKKQLKGLLPNFRLPTVAAHYGYDLREHHHALADAEACAMIALKLLAE